MSPSFACRLCFYVILLWLAEHLWECTLVTHVQLIKSGQDAMRKLVFTLRSGLVCTGSILQTVIYDFNNNLTSGISSFSQVNFVKFHFIIHYMMMILNYITAFERDCVCLQSDSLFCFWIGFWYFWCAHKKQWAWSKKPFNCPKQTLLILRIWCLQWLISILNTLFIQTFLCRLLISTRFQNAIFYSSKCWQQELRFVQSTGTKWISCVHAKGRRNFALQKFVFLETYFTLMFL